MLYNFAADSFYIMKLCSRLFVLHCRSRPKYDKSRHFDPRFEEVRGVVEPWWMAVVLFMVALGQTTACGGSSERSEPPKIRHCDVTSMICTTGISEERTINGVTSTMTSETTAPCCLHPPPPAPNNDRNINSSAAARRPSQSPRETI